MLGLGKKGLSNPLACLISEHGYSLVGLESSDRVRFCKNSYFNEATSDLITKSLAGDVEEYGLYGSFCQLILAPSLYQLVLMDALDVNPKEMAKALRWQLKGLIDYPLNDIAVDAFIVPPHGAGDKRKKVFAAVTLQSALVNRVQWIENCCLKVHSVSIAELALSALLSRFPMTTDAPQLVISYDDEICQLHVFYRGDLYLFRSLTMNRTITQPNSMAKQDMLLEIHRSIDYCLMELKFPEPKHVFFTPAFYEALDLLDFLKEELGKDVQVLDVNSLFASTPIAPDNLAQSFYAMGGVIMPLHERDS